MIYRKHPHYLNGRLVFLLFSQISVGLAFSLRGAMVDRFVYKWADVSSMTFVTQYQCSPSVQAASSSTSTFLHIAVAAAISAVYTSLSISTASILFSVARGSLPLVYQIPFAPVFLRPFTAHFLKGPWAFFLPLTNISLLIRAWALAFTTFFTWETADSMFEKVMEDVMSMSFSFGEYVLTHFRTENSSGHFVPRSQYDVDFWPHLKRQYFQILCILRAEGPVRRTINKCRLSKSCHIWRSEILAQPMGFPLQRKFAGSRR